MRMVKQRLAMVLVASFAVKLVSGQNRFLQTGTCTQDLCCLTRSATTTTTRRPPSCADIHCPPPMTPKFTGKEAAHFACGPLCSYALCCNPPPHTTPPPTPKEPCTTVARVFTTLPPLLNCSRFNCPQPWYTLKTNADRVVCNLHNRDLCSVMSCCSKVPFVTTTIGHLVITCDDIKACHGPFQQLPGTIACGDSCNQKTCCYPTTTTTITTTTVFTSTPCPTTMMTVPSCATFVCPTGLGYTHVPEKSFKTCNLKKGCLVSDCCNPPAPPTTTMPPPTIPPTTVTTTPLTCPSVWQHNSCPPGWQPKKGWENIACTNNDPCNFNVCGYHVCCERMPTTSAPRTTTTLATCDSFTCPVGYARKNVQASRSLFHGPLNNDIAGTGLGGTFGTLDSCKQRCLDEPSCKAIQYSATDKHDDGNNCFIFADITMTGTQYMTFQVWTLARQALPAYKVQTSGTCATPLTEIECKAVATDINAPGHNTNPTMCLGSSCAPGGCYQIDQKVYFNTDRTGKCCQRRKCLCKASGVTCHPHRGCNVRTCCVPPPTTTLGTTPTTSYIPPTTPAPITCVSILPCPYPKVPIPNPGNNFCGAECSYAICCKFPEPQYSCKDFTCPETYTKVPGAASLDCDPQTRCSVQTCCVAPSTIPPPTMEPCSTVPPPPSPRPLTCESIGACPAPSVRKPSASKLLCGTLCSYAMCCYTQTTATPKSTTRPVQSCASFHCPAGFRGVPNRSSLKCSAELGCSFVNCCVKDKTCTPTLSTAPSTQVPSTTPRPLNCGDIHCPENTQHKPKADMLDCGDLCGPVYCCMKFTTTSTTTITTTTLPPPTTITTPAPVNCRSFTCPGPHYAPKKHCSKHVCPPYEAGGCSIAVCCDLILTMTTTKTAYPINCVDVLPCPRPLVPVASPDKIFCGTSWKVTGQCNYQTCCKNPPTSPVPPTTFTTTATTPPPTTTPYTCATFRCPSPVFVPFAAPLAEKITCTGAHSCTVSMCCLHAPTTTATTTTITTSTTVTTPPTTVTMKVLTCADVVCPSPMVPKTSVAKMPCYFNLWCGYHTCCLMPTTTQPVTSSKNPCSTAPTKYECTAFKCPPGYKAKPEEIVCPQHSAGGCSISLCCNLVPIPFVPTTTTSTTPITCSSIFPCPPLWTAKPDVNDKVCTESEIATSVYVAYEQGAHRCSWLQCCDKPVFTTPPPAPPPTEAPPPTTHTTTLFTCSSFTCPPTFVKKPKCSDILCTGPAGCSVILCCNWNWLAPEPTTTTTPIKLTCASILPCQPPMTAKPHAEHIFCHTSCSNEQCCLYPQPYIPPTTVTSTHCTTKPRPYTCQDFNCPYGYRKDTRIIRCKPYNEGGCSIDLCCKPKPVTTTTAPPTTTTVTTTTPRTCASIKGCPKPMTVKPESEKIECGAICSFLQCCDLPPTEIPVTHPAQTTVTTTTTPFHCSGFNCPAPEFKKKPSCSKILCNVPGGCSIPLCCNPVIVTIVTTTTTTTPISCINILPCPLPLIPKTNPASIVCGGHCNFLTCCLWPSTTTTYTTTIKPYPCTTLIAEREAYKCDSYNCPPGYTLDANAKYIFCHQEHSCSIDHCCKYHPEPPFIPPTTTTTSIMLSCASILPCPSPMVPKADPAEIHCGVECNFRLCCDVPTTTILRRVSTEAPTTTTTTTTLYTCDTFQCPAPWFVKRDQADFIKTASSSCPIGYSRITDLHSCKQGMMIGGTHYLWGGAGEECRNYQWPSYGCFAWEVDKKLYFSNCGNARQGANNHPMICAKVAASWVGPINDDIAETGLGGSVGDLDRPINDDIAGTGLGGSVGDLDHCKNRCFNEPSCIAIQFSATDEHDGNNCFIFDQDAMTGSEYESFQIYKLTRQASSIVCPPPHLCYVKLCCVRATTITTTTIRPTSCADFRCNYPAFANTDRASTQCALPAGKLYGASDSQLNGNEGLIQNVGKAKDAKAVSMTNLGVALFLGCLAAVACTSLAVNRHRRRQLGRGQYVQMYTRDPSSVLLEEDDKTLE